MKKALLVLGLAVILAAGAQATMIVGVDSGMGIMPINTIATVVGGGAAPSIGGAPFIGFVMNKDMSFDVGLTLASVTPPVGNSISVFGIWGRLNGVMATISNLKLGWSGQLGIASGSAGGTSTTHMQLNGALFAEYKVADNLGIYGNVNLLTFMSTGSSGSTTTTIALGTGDANAYTGVRVYL